MLRVALIGCGAEADPYLTAARCLPGVEVTAAADPDPDRAIRLAEYPGVQLRAASLEELLATAAEGFDAVLVTIPPPAARASLIAQAAAAGKHVLVEPPLAGTAEEAERAAASARAAGVRLMPVHEARFRADCRAVKDSLDQGELGRPGLLRIHDWAPEAEARGHTFPRALAAVDLALWVFDGPPTQVFASVRPPGAPCLAEAEYLQVHLGFEGGGMALIDVHRALPAGDGYRSLALIGSLGAAHADDHHNAQLLYGGGRAQAVLTEADESVPALVLSEFAAGRRRRTGAGGDRRGRSGRAAGRRGGGLLVGRGGGLPAVGRAV